MNIVADPRLDLMERLEQLESGELDVVDARAVVRHALAEADEEIHEEVYASLRGWTGRALRSAMSSGELRGWHSLIGAASARMGLDAEWGIRADVLAELVYERAGMAESRAPEKVASRRHAPEILGLLTRQPSRALSRADIQRELGLGQANLTRVCNLLAEGGLVLRRPEGRTVSYEITAAGLAHAAGATPATVDAVAEALGGSWDLASGEGTETTCAPSPLPLEEWHSAMLADWGSQEAANDDFEYAMAA